MDEMNVEVPPPLEKGNISLSTFATPGEYEPLSFVVYSQKEVKGVRVKVSPLKMGKEVIPAENIDVRYGMRTAQRKRYPVPPTHYLIRTTFLRRFDKLDLREKEFREIFLTIKVPEEAKPGLYKGSIIVSPENLQASEISLSLEVLPFKLKEVPHKRYGMYYYLSKGFVAAPDTVDIELQDMKAHGIDVFYPSLGIRYSTEETGDIVPDYSAIEKGLSILRKNGFKKATVIIDTGFVELYTLLGHKISPSDTYKDKDKIPELLNDQRFLQLAKNAIEGLESVKKKFPEFEILLTHLDEVFNNGRLPLYIALTKAAKQVPGWKYYITFDTQFPERDAMRKEIDPYVDVRSRHTFSFEWWLARGHTIEEYNQELKESGDIAAAYPNPVGAYTDAEYYRIFMGIENWIMPFTYQIPWIYNSISKDPFNDLDGNWSDFVFGFYSEKDKEFVSTKIWEGFREGRDDLRYLYTLETLIKENKERNPKTAKEAEEWLKEVRSMLPKPQGLPCDNWNLWGTENESPFTRAIANKFSFEDYQNIRRKTATYIIKLTGSVK